MRARSSSLSIARGSSVALAFVIVACSSSSTKGTSGATAPLSFHGTKSPFPGFAYDTGSIPGTGPASVDLSASITGELTGDAQATSGGREGDPTVAAIAGSGKFALDAHVKLGGTLHIAVTGVPRYDGPIPGIDNVDIAFGGSVSFDPFLIGEDAPLTVKLPATKLPPIPLPGGIPGELDLTVADGSTITSIFHGVCAGVAGGMATYEAQTTSSASVVISPSIVIHVPIVGDQTVTIPSFTVNVPASVAAFPMGSVVAPAGGAAPTGTSLATKGGCAAAADPRDGGETDGAPGTMEDPTNDAASGPGGDDGSTTPNDSGGGSCSPNFAGGTPAYHPPTGAHQNVCTSAQIDQFATACAVPTTGCDTTFGAGSGNAACEACLVSQQTDTAWGAFFNDGIFLQSNEDGCFALEDSSQTACARANQQYISCTYAAEAACLASCPTGGARACIVSADSTVCASENTASGNCATVFSESAWAPCISNVTSGAAHVTWYANFFCGP